MNMSMVKELFGKGWVWFVEYFKAHKWKTVALLEALWIGFMS